MRRCSTTWLVVVSVLSGPAVLTSQADQRPAPSVRARVGVAATSPAPTVEAVATRMAPTAALPWTRADVGPEGQDRFVVRQPGATTSVTKDEVRVVLPAGGPGAPPWILAERLVGGVPSPLEPGLPSATRVSEFRGNDPARWRADQPSWSSVRRRGVYPGVDLELRVTGARVEKIFTIAPGGPVAPIRVAVEGAEALALLPDGSLELRGPAGEVRFSPPVAWQGEGAGRLAVEVRYRVDGLTYGFDVGAYDESKPLVIDPVLISTFVGGDGLDQLTAIALGPDGNVYVTGLTQPFSGAMTPYPFVSAYDGSANGAQDIVVSKFTPDLTRLLASTYVGGDRLDAGRKIAFDASGNVFVAGETFSTNFPTLGASSWEATFSGGGYSGVEGFVIKLSSSLASLRGSTYLGGYWYTAAAALAVNPADGSVFVAGQDDRSDKASWTPAGRTLPATGYLKDPIASIAYGFIARFDNALTNMTALTFLYGPRTCTTEGGREYCPRGTYEIADLGVANGSLYGVGRTGDWTFPTTAGAYDRAYSTGTTYASKFDDVSDVLLVKFDLGLATLQGSTYLGGKHEDYAKGIAFDGKGNVFLTGSTNGGAASTSVNPEMFPVTPQAFDVTSNGSWEAFVARLDPALTTLQASTFVGGADAREEWANDIAVAPGTTGAPGEGDVFIGGTAWGSVPTGVRAFQETAAWELYGLGWYHENPFIVRLDWKLQRVLAATYLQSGGDGEQIVGIAVTATAPRDVFVTGYASRVDFPVTEGAYDTTFAGGNQDGFVARLPATLAQPGILVNVRGPEGIAPGQRGTFTVNYANGLDLIASNVVIAATVPAGMNLVDIGGGGVFYPGGGGCTGEILWRVASMNPADMGAVTFTVEVPWGAPDAVSEITARGAAANEATPYFDVAPYLAFVPEPHPTSVELDANGLAAQWSAFPAARRLLDYATSIGYRFFGTAVLDTMADATRMLRLHLFAPDGGLATLAATGERAFIDRFVGETYVQMDADGGFTWDRTAGTLTPFGGWATTTQPTGPLTLALGDESDRAVWAMAATGLQVARCRFNCMLNSIPEVALSKLSAVYKTVSAAKNCTLCALSVRSGTPNNEACLKCSAAMSKQLQAAKDLAPVIGDALKAYYIIGNCEADCAKNPNKHICTQDKWECCSTILSWLGGFDAKCRTVCNRTTGTYAPVITDRVNCAYGQTCHDGACGAKPQCTGVSCAQRQVRSRPARDPNAKAVSPGGSVLPGERLTYTIDYENVGAGVAEAVFVLDTLDTDLDAASLALDPRCNYVTANRLVACTIGTLAAAGQPGAKGSVSFSAKPLPGLAMGTDIVNQADVHFPSAFEITPTNAVVNRIDGLRADPLWFSTSVATPVGVTLRGASADGAAVSFRVTRPPLNGTLTGTGAALTYTPAANFSGGDDFEYVASNGVDQSLPATVSIGIAPNAATDAARPTVVLTSPASGATGVVATTLDVSGSKVYGPMVLATFSEPMDAATLTASSLTVSGIAGQVVYDGRTRTVSWLPSAALSPATTYTATIGTAVRDASGNALASAHTWSFRTAGASEPNIHVALPDAGASPVAVGASLSNRRRTISVSNIGTANLKITDTALMGGDDYAFIVSADGCTGQTLAPSASCSMDVSLGASVSPVKTSALRVTSNDPDRPALDVPLTTTTAAPPAPYSYFLAEGATVSVFDTFIAIANPGPSAATALLKFLGADGSVVTHDLAVPARSRRTVSVRDVPGMDDAEFATTVESDQPLVVERTMLWDRSVRYGAHAERALTGPSPVWYLAEGATHSGFDLFYLLQNPGVSPIDVKVRYLLPGGVAPVEKVYRVGANARQNIWVDFEEIPAGSGQYPLANTDVGAVISSVGGESFVAERAMYLSNQGRLFNAGHESAGVTAPAQKWFLAEGATGDFFDLFILIANPGAAPTTVKATYLLDDGSTYEKTYEVAGSSRTNIWVDHEEIPSGSGRFPLRATAVSTTVESLSPSVPIIVERAMWWPGAPGQWYGAHNSPGSTASGPRWAVADGEASALCDTYILVANTSPFAAQARVTLLYEDGTTSPPHTVALLPNSRTNVVPETEIAGAANRRWAAVIEGVDTGAGVPQLVVERAMYWNGGGVMFAAGSNAQATRLP